MSNTILPAVLATRPQPGTNATTAIDAVRKATGRSHTDDPRCRITLSPVSAVVITMVSLAVSCPKQPTTRSSMPCGLHRSAMRTNPKGVEVYGPRAVRCRSRQGLMGGHQPFLLEREEDVFTSEASSGRGSTCCGAGPFGGPRAFVHRLPSASRQMRALRGSADALGQRDDDP